MRHNPEGAFVSGLWIYPIKSAAGIPMQEVRVEERGFTHDRRWMLIDDQRVFLSQRTIPSIRLIRVRIGDGCLNVEAPGMEPIRVVPPDARTPVIPAVLWEDVVEVIPSGALINEWFSTFLGRRCTLVYMPDTSHRRVDTRYVKEGIVSFADGYPVLLTSEGSLRDLNDRLAEPVCMGRFRPNLVVDGVLPFEEDAWNRFHINDAYYHAVKPCTRCVVTTIDQSTGASGKEPLSTLAAYRKWNGKVVFGQNVMPVGPLPAAIRLGDRVEVSALAKSISVR